MSLWGQRFAKLATKIFWGFLPWKFLKLHWGFLHASIFYFCCFFGKLMSSYIHSEFNWPLAGAVLRTIYVPFFCRKDKNENTLWTLVFFRKSVGLNKNFFSRKIDSWTKQNSFPDAFLRCHEKKTKTRCPVEFVQVGISRLEISSCHICHRWTQGRLFWITCKRLKLLRQAGCLQLPYFLI